MKQKNVLLVVVLLLVLSGIYLAMSTNLFSVVSQSNINFDAVNNKWIATNLVVDNDEQLDFLSSSFVDNSIDSTTIQSAKANKGFSFRTKQQQPYCSYNLNWDLININLIGFTIQSIPYAKVTGLPVLNVPYEFTVLKPDNTSETKQANASLLGQSSYWFYNNQVEVKNLGQLSNGISCPTEGIALYPIYSNNSISGWRLASQSSIDSYKASINNYVNSCVFNPSSCLGQIASYLSNPGISAPNVSFVSSNIDTISQGSTKFIGYIPQGSAYANILISASASFVDTVIVYRPNGTPQTTISFSKNSLKQSESTVMTVNVKNVGVSADNFQIIPNTNGVVSFNPQAQQTGSIAKDATVSKTFQVYALGSGTPNVCVDVQSMGSGQSTSTCQTITVSAISLPPAPSRQPVEVCGNGACVSTSGENYYSCPQDCGTPPTPAICGNKLCEGLEYLTCNSDCPAPTPTPSAETQCLSRNTDLWVVGWNWDPGLLGLGAKCNPITNWTLVFGIFVVVVVVSVGGFFLFKKKSKRGR